jgi:hypothetical protein
MRDGWNVSRDETMRGNLCSEYRRVDVSPLYGVNVASEFLKAVLLSF